MKTNNNKNKKFLLLFYGSIALVCLGIFFFSFSISKHQKKKRELKKPLPIYANLSDKNLFTTNQEGKKVSLHQLKGKVWIFCQFFLSCPQCAKRNYEDLLKIAKIFRKDKNFHIVCISINPEEDTTEKLKIYAQTLKVDVKNWWLLTGDKKTLYSYMREKMLYPDIIARTDKEEIITKGKFAHDLSIAVFDDKLQMRDKVDLYFAKNYSKDLYRKTSKELIANIRKLLKENAKNH